MIHKIIIIYIPASISRFLPCYIFPCLILYHVYLPVNKTVIRFYMMVYRYMHRLTYLPVNKTVIGFYMVVFRYRLTIILNYSCLISNEQYFSYVYVKWAIFQLCSCQMSNISAMFMSNEQYFSYMYVHVRWAVFQLCVYQMSSISAMCMSSE
jgi:hypothetical protein